jgi:hypothetical protein
LHRLPEFTDFLSLVRKAAKGAVDFLDIEYRDFTVTGSKSPFQNSVGGCFVGTKC